MTIKPTNALLLFVGEEGPARWLRLAGGAVAARGAGAAPADDGNPPRIVAAVPGERVAVHWLEFPAGLAPAQAAAAARLLAADLSAQPIEEMHVAVGPEDEAGLRCVALVANEDMAAWLARCQAEAVDPDVMLPQPLLLPAPANGTVLRHDGGGLPWYRGAADAFAAEPELAGLMLPRAHFAELDGAAFEAGLAATIAVPAVDLRQGRFAKRRRWRIDWKLVRRLGWLGLAVLSVSLVIQVALIMRYTFAADHAEAERRLVAERALPGTRITNAERQLALAAAEAGEGSSYSEAAAALFAGVQATPNVELGAIAYDASGALRATVRADGAAELGALRQRLEAGGWSVAAGPLRVAEGRQRAELTMRAR